MKYRINNSSINFSYHNPLKRGVRIAIRPKVNDNSITGPKVVDRIIPVGLGQRQLVLGDRYTGKTTVSIPMLLYSSSISRLVGIDGFGTRRIIGSHIGISQNLSKPPKSIKTLLFIIRTCLIIATHSAPSSPLPYMIPLIGISIGERLRDRGNNIPIRSDDPPKHSKSYRQTPSILAKIPSRDALPSDIPNVHPALLERCGKSSAIYPGGTISASPIIETISPDITEYIATNTIPITDRQSYTNKQLPLDSCRPAIDSGLPASRIGSNAQSKRMKNVPIGIKNESNYYRNSEIEKISPKYIPSNNISFQDHLFIPAIEAPIPLSLAYRNRILSKDSTLIHR